MKAEITFSQLWYNPSVLGFFFRTQSEKTLDKLMDCAVDDSQGVCDLVNNYAEINNLDLDEIEEMFYNDSVEELAEEFGIELIKEDEGDED